MSHLGIFLTFLNIEATYGRSLLGIVWGVSNAVGDGGIGTA